IEPQKPPPGSGKRPAKAPPVWEMTIDQVGDWAGACADAVARLAAPMRQGLEDEKLTRLYEDIERPLIPVLAEMERVGIAVDASAMEAMSVEFGKPMRDLEARIYAAAGHEFNVASTRELCVVLFEELELPVLKRLKTGPSTDQDVLEKLAEQHELPR